MGREGRDVDVDVKHRSKRSKRVSNKNKPKKSHHRKRKNDSEVDIEDADNIENIDNVEEIEERNPVIEEKTRLRLKHKINEWLDFDDKIKDLNAKAKRYKDAKKQQEELILKMINKMGVNDNKIDVHDHENNFRGRVYRYKSVTKGAIKEDIIKNALMEIIRDEKKVNQLVKKIDSKRPINERYYLKRTKGNKEE